MAKNLIVGCSDVFSFEDKKTGKDVKCLKLYVSRDAMDTYGTKTGEVVVTGPGVKQFEQFEDDISQIIGLTVEVDYNSKGKLENVALVCEPVAKK